MNDNEVDAILSEWELRIAQIKLFDTPERLTFGNVNVAVDRFRSLASFLQYYVPRLREWMNVYLEENRKEIFVEFCGSELHIQLFNLLDHETIQKHIAEWDAVFGNTPICYKNAEEVALEIYRKRPFSECNDTTILAIHEGKECDINPWFGCYLCENQESQWNQLLTRQLEDSNHPLRNSKLRLNIHVDYSTELEQCVLWTPPRSTSGEYSSLSKKAGQTVFQQMKAMIDHVIGLWDLSYGPYHKIMPMYRRFFQVWNTIDRIPRIIQQTLPDIVDLEYT
jgi:hypothetical protein